MTEEMKEFLDKTFRFSIGQHVSHLRAPGDPDPHKYPPLIVVGRLIEQCPGGVQLHYSVASRDFSAPNWVHEQALEPFVRPPTEEEKLKQEMERWVASAKVRRAAAESSPAPQSAG